MAKDSNSGFSAALGEKLTGLFNSQFDSQRAYYSKEGVKKPTKDQIDNLVFNAANTNAVISGGMSLIPGPFGMLSLVPEIILVIRNQINLVYDIGVACGKEKELNNEILMYVFLSSMGSTGIGLATVHGSKVLVKRASLQVMQKLIALLGGKITQRALKALVARWLPFVGAAAMAYWTRSTTVSIGEKAKEIFMKDIVMQDEVFDANFEIS